MVLCEKCRCIPFHEDGRTPEPSRVYHHASPKALVSSGSDGCEFCVFLSKALIEAGASQFSGLTIDHGLTSGCGLEVFIEMSAKRRQKALSLWVYKAEGPPGLPYHAPATSYC